MNDYDDIFTPEFCGLPTGFCGIPYAEGMLNSGSPRFYPPPPRNRGTYSGYNSLGNVVGRINRASAVQNVEDYYYGGTQVRDYNRPPPGQQKDKDDMIDELRESRKVIVEMKQQYRTFLYFLIFVVVFSLLVKSGIIKLSRLEL